jgi:hypothetical protein
MDQRITSSKSDIIDLYREESRPENWTLWHPHRNRSSDLTLISIREVVGEPAIWIWVKEKWGRLGHVAVGGAELLTRVRVAWWKAWPAVGNGYIISLLLWIFQWWQYYLSSVQWVAGRRCSYSPWTLQCPRSCAAGCKFLFEKASLYFPSCLCIGSQLPWK